MYACVYKHMYILSPCVRLLEVDPGHGTDHVRALASDDKPSDRRGRSFVPESGHPVWCSIVFFFTLTIAHL